MSFSLPFPLINGVRHSWSSISCDIAGLTIAGITAVNYEATLEPGVVYAGGPLPIATTTGVGSYTADIELLLAEFHQVQNALGPAFFTTVFDVKVSYSDEGYTASGVPVIIDTIQRARISKVSAGAQKQSGDAIVRKLTLVPLGMLFNGVNPMPNQPSFSIGGVAGAASGIVQRLNF
jgi:hypothetical protein